MLCKQILEEPGPFHSTRGPVPQEGDEACFQKKSWLEYPQHFLPLVNCFPLPSPTMLSTQALPNISHKTLTVSSVPPHPS